MRDGWKTQPLGALLDTVIDHRGKTPKKLGGDFTTTGVPVVSAIHIKGGRIVWAERERYVNADMAARWMKIPTKRNDVLLTSEAPLGEVALVPDDHPLVLSQRLFGLRGKSGVLDSRYLKWFLASTKGRSLLEGRATGTTVVGIRQEQLLKVPIDYPPLEDQRRISAVLGALDDLIDTNQRLTGKLNEVAAATALRALRLASSRVTLGEVAAHLPGKYLPKDRYLPTGQFVVYGSNSIMGKYSEALYDGPLTVLARIGSNCGALRLSSDGAWVNNNASAIKANSGQPAYWIHAALEQIDMDDHRAGTGQPFIRIESLMKESIPWGDHALLYSTNETLGELAKAATTLSEEARAIATARDELLPLLMSGAVSPGEVTVAS